MQVTFTIPDAIATELNQIAVKAGYANAKLMVIAYLKATISSNRVQALDFKALQENAEKQAATDTASIV